MAFRTEVIGDCTLILGECREVMATLGDGSVDAVCCDPPAGIKFMGKEWDTFPVRDRADYVLPDGRSRPGLVGGWEHRGGEKYRQAFIAFLSAAMSEALRVLKPCHYGLVWAIPRTSHWTGTALEEAGWEIRDRISHLFGTGFPKGQGCLKPACEDWWLVRKPGRGVLPLSIDECRVPYLSESDLPENAYSYRKDTLGQPVHKRSTFVSAGMVQPGNPAGRYPANVVLSHVDGPDGCRQVGVKKVKAAKNNGGPAGASRNGTMGDFSGKAMAFDYADADGLEEVADWACHPDCPVAELGRYGERRPGERPARQDPAKKGWKGGWTSAQEGTRVVLDGGSAARFFYCAKASRSDRGEGNTHPTAKSTELMRWLVQLISRPGDVVLDPFAGSFSTALACMRAGRKFIGIESSEEYFEIGKRRIQKELEKTPLFTMPRVEEVG